VEVEVEVGGGGERKGVRVVGGVMSACAVELLDESCRLQNSRRIRRRRRRRRRRSRAAL